MVNNIPQAILIARVEMCLRAYAQAVADTSNDKLSVARHNAAVEAMTDARNELDSYGFSIRYDGTWYKAEKREG